MLKKYFQISKLINKECDKYKIIKRKIKIDEIERNIKGKFIIPEVKNEIKVMKFHYSIIFNNGIINISSHYEIKKSKKLDILIKISNYFYNKSLNKKKLNSYFYLTNLKRKLYKDNSYFGPKQVNGGYNNLTNNILVVWRKEDGIKVFIHEMIHFFKLDKYFVDNFYLSINNFQKICKNNDYVFEAFTDFYAMNYYFIYLSLLYNKNITEIYNKSFNFMKYQAHKIIYYSNFKNSIINNDTNVYCYYLLKYYLFLKFSNKKLCKINIKQMNKIIINSILYFKKIKINEKFDDNLNMCFYQVYL